MSNMKITPSHNLIENIRSAIRTSKERLDENKQQRKALITKISKQKLEVRTRESHISTLEEAKFHDRPVKPELIDLARHDLKREVKVLEDLRQHLLVAETFHAVEVAGFRALHKRLDVFNVPFDPVRKAAKI